jgi:hypothetical protein
LVVGHYQPLADNHGIAPWPDQTRSLQSDQRTFLKTLEKTRSVLTDPFECLQEATNMPRLKSKGPGAFEAPSPL